MKRSGGVTAAGIVLFIGSALLVLMAAIMVLGSFVVQSTKEPNPFGPAIFYVEAGFMLTLAGFGIATAVGILRLRNWARISILVMSGLAAAMMLFSSLSMLMVVPMMKQDPKMPSGAIAIFAIFEVVLFAIPLGISIWWLILFSLKSVRMQFATGTQGAVPQPIAVGGMPVAAMPEAPGSSAGKIPVSIVVIAIYCVAVAPFSLFALAFPLMRRMPVMLFGRLLWPGSGWIFMPAFSIVLLVLGVGLLERKLWAWAGMCVYAIFLIVNSLASALHPHVLDQMIDVLRQAMPELAQFYTAMPGLRAAYYFGVVFGLAKPIVALYFLWTTRKAYRAACVATR